ncbi:MAG: CAP domain-containing protein [Kofleriaceae bacterium]
MTWDPRVADVARTYSNEMRTTKVVAHISPTSGSAADRVRAAKVKTAVVLENVARAYGLGEAHHGLMNSPGHRANVLSHHATHVGIGVVYGDEVSGRREIFITQVFTRVPPKVDPQQSADEIRKKIIATRQVNVSPKLTAIAQGMANQLAAGKTREQAYPAVKRQVDALGNKYARVGSVVTAASELDSIDGPAILGEATPDDIGIGIAQGVHPEIGEGAIWIVVLLAEARN